MKRQKINWPLIRLVTGVFIVGLAVGAFVALTNARLEAKCAYHLTIDPFGKEIESYGAQIE